MLFKLLVATLACASASKLGASKVQLKTQPKAADKALALRGGGLSLEQASLFGSVYFGGFGVTLLANPDFFYGPDGLLPYFHTPAGPIGTFFGRAFGACMTAMAYTHFTSGPTAELVKQFAVAGILFLPQMYANFVDQENFVHFMWTGQIAIHVVLCYLLAQAGGLF